LQQKSTGSSLQLDRRSFLTAASMAVLSACGRSPATGYPGFALVTLGGENSVAIIDLNRFRVAGRHSFSAQPSLVVGRSSTAYILTPSNGTIHALNPSNPAELRSARLSAELDLLRVAPQRDRLVAVSSVGRELIVVNAADLKPLRRKQLSSSPVDLDVKVHSAAKRSWAALSGGKMGMVETVDLESGAKRSRQLEGELGALRFRSDGELLFVANYARQSLMVLDTETLVTMCELPLPMKPENLAFGADNGQLFVSGPGMDGISIVYTYKTIEVDQTVLAAKQPGCMACSNTPRYLFVASRAGSEIAILNVDTRRMVALSLGGSKTTRIVVTPDQQYALFLNEGSGDLAIIRIPEIRNSRARKGESRMPSQIITLRGVSLFAMLPLGEKPVDIALTDQTA
jgi:hypothetical protein